MGTFFSAFAQADFFGKLIFLSLFSLSIICWFLLLHRIWLIKQVQATTHGFIKVVQQAKGEILSLQAEKLPKVRFKEIPHPFAHIYLTLKEKTREILEKNHYFEQVYLTTPDVELIESHLHLTIAKEKENIEKNFFVLATTVTLAPFLGLLGTVWGILLTFSELKLGGSISSNAVILGGLSTALTTTVLGLLIAIPALVSYNYLKNASKRLLADMHRFSHLLLSTVELQYRNPRGE